MSSMNAEQADVVLAALTAGYPHVNLTDDQLVYWADAIQDSDADIDRTLEIARRWARTHERFPSLADFLAVITPRTYIEPVDDDPDQVRLNPRAGRRVVRMWRQALAESAQRVAELGGRRGDGGHWHGGPAPCPLCGGEPPIR